MPESIEIPMPRGTCRAYVFGDGLPEDAPVVLQFMDAFGLRPAQFKIAGRFAAEGWRVVMPDSFYEHAPYENVSTEAVFGGKGGPDRDRLMSMLGGLSLDMVGADVAALVDYCKQTWGADVRIGAIGYCMGGRFALAAATVSPNVVAAAAFHASNLAPAQGDGVHQRLAGCRAQVYVGIAGIDPSLPPEEGERLRASLEAAGVPHEIETYEGKAHGFVPEDLPVYDAEAAEQHFERATGLFRKAFGE